MHIADEMDFERAVTWLTTSGFEQSPLTLLAVVLARSDTDADLLEKLTDNYLALHAGSERALVMAVGDRSKVPDVPVPARDEGVRAWWELHFGTRTVFAQPHDPGVHFAGVLSLLGLPEAALPCIYLRTRDASPMVVTISDASVAVEFLVEALILTRPGRVRPFNPLELSSLAATHGMVALAVPSETQAALDSCVGRRAPSQAAAAGVVTVSDEGWDEVERVRIATRYLPGGQHARQCAQVYDELVNSIEITLPVPGHRLTLRTASTAHANGDWGTVCRNLGCVIESSLTATLLHVVRGLHGVSLPGHIGLVDPEAGRVKLQGVQLNDPQWKVLVDPRGRHPAVVGRVPWRAPTLEDTLRTIESTAPRMGWLPDAALSTLVDLSRRMADRRNPASHSIIPGQDDARAAWDVLQTWHDRGCAHALWELSEELARWPDTQPRAFSAIQAGWGDARDRSVELARQRLEYARAHLVAYEDVAELQKRCAHLEAEGALWTRALATQLTDVELVALPLDGPHLRNTPALTPLRALRDQRLPPFIVLRRLSRLHLWLDARPEAFAAVGRSLQALDATPDTVGVVLDGVLAAGDARWRSETARAQFDGLLENLWRARAELEGTSRLTSALARDLLHTLLAEVEVASLAAADAYDAAARSKSAASERLSCAISRLRYAEERGVEAPCTCGGCDGP